MVDEIELKAEGIGLILDLFYTLSVVKVQGKHLATFKEGFDAPWTFPLGAFLEDEGGPGLATGYKAGQGLWSYLLNIGTKAGANDPHFGTWVAEFVYLVAVLELRGRFMVPLLKVE